MAFTTASGFGQRITQTIAYYILAKLSILCRFPNSFYEDLYEIADQENAHITALHIYPMNTEPADVDDKLDFLREVVVDELGSFPTRLKLHVVQSERVTDGGVT